MPTSTARFVRPRDQPALEIGDAAAGRHGDDLAEHSVADRLADREIVRRETKRMTDQQAPGLRLRHGDQGVGIRQRVRDRLLAEHEQSVPERPGGDFAVCFLRGAYEHCLEPGQIQQGAKVACAPDAGGCPRGGPRVGVAAAHQVRERRGRQDRGMLLPDHPEPHHGAAHRFHQAHPPIRCLASAARSRSTPRPGPDGSTADPHPTNESSVTSDDSK